MTETVKLYYRRSEELRRPAALPGLFHQRRAHLKCLFAFLWEHRFVTRFFGFRIKQRPGPVQLAVIFQLQRVTADKNFCRTYQKVQGLAIIFQQLGLIRIRRVAGHDQQHGNHVGIAAIVFLVIRKVLESQTLIYDCSCIISFRCFRKF